MQQSPSPQHKPDIRKANPCPSLPKDSSILDTIIYWLGIGLGSGRPKKAPGTWGTVGGLLVALPMLVLGFYPFLLITVLSALVGCYICGRTSMLMLVHDDPHIVWDEWAGMWISLLPVSWFFQHSPFNMWQFITLIIIAFVAFRMFDILKPFPIGWADSKVSGGLGIMLDDILAGLMSCIVLVLILYIFMV